MADPSGASPWARRREVWAVLGLTLLALLLRGYELGATSLWADEAFSAWMAAHGAAEIWPLTWRIDTHPPLYYALLQRWAGWFGDGEASLRALSVAFAAATLPVVHLAGRALAPRPADAPWLGGVAAALFALAPFQLAYAQEARSYAALVLAAALALLGALRLAGRPELLAVPWLGWRDGRARSAWAPLAAGWAGCLWLHNLGGLVLAATGAPLLALAWADPRRRRAAAANLALAGLLAALLWLPNLPGTLAQLGQVARGFWLAPPDLAAFAQVTARLLALDRLGSKDPWPLLLGLQAWGLVWLARRGRGRQALLLLAVVALGLGAAVAVSYAWVPVFLDRTLIWVALPGYLALAAGVVGLPRPRARPVGVALVLALFAWGAFAYHARKAKEPWRDVVGAVAARWQPGDEVAVAPPYGAKAVAYYRRRAGIPGDVLLPRWEDPAEGQERPELERRLAAAGRVWLVTRTEGRFDPRRYWVTERLAGERPRLLREEFDDRLGLDLYGPPRTAP